MARPRKFPLGIVPWDRPKMSNHRGRTWDYCRVVLPSGQEIKGHLDTTWGECFYFEDPDTSKWYKGPLSMDTGKDRFLVHVDLRS